MHKFLYIHFHNTPQPIQTWLITLQPSINCMFVSKKKNLISTVASIHIASDPKKDSAFVNTNINIPPNLCGAVTMNGGLADWFSFLTRAVEKQFNLFSSLLPWETIFFLFILYLCFPLQKCQHDFVSTKHILCCDRYHLTPIYERHGTDTSP